LGKFVLVFIISYKTAHNLRSRLSAYQHDPVRLKLDEALSLDKCSVPWNFSLSNRELSVEFGVGIAINLHALDAAIGLTLIGVEEAIRALVMI
jgi:hypothetical protein